MRPHLCLPDRRNIYQTTTDFKHRLQTNTLLSTIINNKNLFIHNLIYSYGFTGITVSWCFVHSLGRSGKSILIGTAHNSIQFTRLRHHPNCSKVPSVVYRRAISWPFRHITKESLSNNHTASLSFILDLTNLAISHTVRPQGFIRVIFVFNFQLFPP